LFKLVLSAINYPLLALVQMDLAHRGPSTPTIPWKAAPAIAAWNSSSSKRFLYFAANPAAVEPDALT
jgi:hypothetical protein